MFNSFQFKHPLSVFGTHAKHIYFFPIFILLFSTLLFSPHGVQATSFNTITIDGTNDFVADETFTTSSAGYTTYATWDANNLYLGYTGGDIGSGESADKWIVWYIDTDPQCGSNTGNGTNYAQGFNTQNWSLPFKADYFMQVRTNEGLNQLNTWNGLSWAASSYTGTIFDNDGANFMELSLPLTDIGSPEHIRILGYFINEQAGSEWTYANWPDTSLAGNDGYKRFGAFYNWYEFTLADNVSPNAAANFTPAQNCTIDNSVTEWAIIAESGAGSGAYEVGPGTPPAGVGSARLTTPAAADGHTVGTFGFAGTRLADISSLSYSTYRASGDAAWMPSLAFSINYDLTSTTGWEGRLTFEPYVQIPAPTLANNTWYTWDTLNGGNGRWWASGVPGNGPCGQGNPCTWNTILATYPNAGINFVDSQFLSKAGSNWAGFSGNVDDIAITINGASYTFDLEPYLPVHNITQNTDHPTIQAGVTAASPGDILVADPGTYVENVIINKSLTLRGLYNSALPAQQTILDGSSLGTTTSGIQLTAGVTNVTIQDLTVQNYTMSSSNHAGIAGAGGNNNFTALRVKVLNNINGRGGLYLNGPVDTVLIDHVTAHNNQGRGIVIWNGFKTHITITNNDVRNNNCCGIELQDGTASGVTITGNTVVNNTDSGIAATGLMGGAGPNVIANNTVTDNGRFGIEIKLPNGNGLSSGDGSIVVENNTVSRTFIPADARDLAGIAVFRRGWLAGNVDIPTGVLVRNNNVSNYQQTTTSDGFGIVVEGTNMTVSNNTLNNNDVGVQLQAGHLPYTANTNIDGNQNNLADQYFGRGNSPVGCAAILNNTFSGNSVNTRNVGSVGGGTVVNTNTGETFCSIQAAIDDADTLSGHTIQVAAGTYVEELDIDKSLTLQGPNVGINPNSGSRIAEAVILPATSNPDPAVCTVIAYLATSGITIDGFTFDGDNPALTSGIMIGTADVDACEILAGYEGMGNTVIENNILRHSTYSAIDFYNYINNAATSGNYIRDNLIQNIGETTYNVGIGILNYNNFYADVVDNVLENVRVGIQTGNYSQANPGSTGQISHNEINAWRLGIFHNLWYSNASVISVSNNTINAIDHPTPPTWNGILVSSWQNTANTLLVDNTVNIGNITQLASGYNIWNTPTTAPLTISGGSVSGGDYGVFVNNYDGYASNASNTAIVVDGVTISDAALAGVYAKDNPSNTNNATVAATIQNSDLSGNEVAFLVTGPDASMTAKGNTVDDSVTVFDVTGGALTAYANNITNFTTGVNNTSGALNARHNWWGNITPVGVNDTAAFDYRLGAAVGTWGEGSLGSATLTSAGGSGTGVIVSHGRGLANVPFGKGVDPYASAMCSDYYDFFVLNASGNWTVSVPIDAAGACDDTVTNNALYEFALTNTMPDTACVGGACWLKPNGVAANGRSLEVTLDAGIDLVGTPFVAGDNTPDSNDPTAVSLSTFSASTNTTGVVTAVILLFLLLTTFVLWKRRAE